MPELLLLNRIRDYLDPPPLHFLKQYLRCLRQIPVYGSAKAAQAHLSRLMAAELGADKIRVNTVNPDAVISDSNIWSGGWAEGRAKAYGIRVEELPAYYAKRTLLNEIILPDDIANACFAFVGGLLDKSTGNALNVDGGVSMGFYR